MAGTLALLIPVIAVSGLFIFLIGLTPIGKAVAERIRHGPVPPAAGAGGDDVVAAVEELRREVAELAERVDFTERLVAKAQGAHRLEPPH
jgi:hypothetical protein